MTTKVINTQKEKDTYHVNSYEKLAEQCECAIKMEWPNDLVAVNVKVFNYYLPFSRLN